jgi:hypothetical protein
MLKVFPYLHLRVLSSLIPPHHHHQHSHMNLKRREWGWRKRKRKIYFQHFQHNKINDLLLYHHNVLRNCTQQVGAALRLSLYVCTDIHDSLVGGHVRCWRCSPIRVTKIVQHRSSATQSHPNEWRKICFFWHSK